MQTFKCSKCLIEKESSEFYKNSNKKNGLESNCKSCVLARKAKKYDTFSKVKKKTKLLRLQSKVSVLDVVECTFNEVLINRPSNCETNDLLKDLVKGVLCYQDIKKFKASAIRE